MAFVMAYLIVFVKYKAFILVQTHLGIGLIN